VRSSLRVDHDVAVVRARLQTESRHLSRVAERHRGVPDVVAVASTQEMLLCVPPSTWPVAVTARSVSGVLTKPTCASFPSPQSELTPTEASFTAYR